MLWNNSMSCIHVLYQSLWKLECLDSAPVLYCACVRVEGSKMKVFCSLLQHNRPLLCIVIKSSLIWGTEPTFIYHCLVFQIEPHSNMLQGICSFHVQGKNNKLKVEDNLLCIHVHSWSNSKEIVMLFNGAFDRIYQSVIWFCFIAFDH